MIEENKNFALEALKASYDKMILSVPWIVVEKCYLVELEGQYEKERLEIKNKMKNLISHFIADQVGKNDL